jgi:hypothetical protein
MAKSTPELAHVLRKTAAALRSSPAYQWGHMGLCNCGFLAQQVTRLTKEEIHSRAMQRYGDWSEQLNDYCPTSGLPMDELISEMMAFGFDADDLRHLERLSDPQVLRQLPAIRPNLSFNIKEDVITYLEAWANKIDEDIIRQIRLPLHELAVVPA